MKVSGSKQEYPVNCQPAMMIICGRMDECNDSGSIQEITAYCIPVIMIICGSRTRLMLVAVCNSTLHTVMMMIYCSRDGYTFCGAAVCKSTLCTAV